MSSTGMLARGIVAGRAALRGALAVAVVAALAGPASAGAVELPEKDPFYKPPAGNLKKSSCRKPP